MRYQDIEAHISKLCTGLVMRVREQTRSMGRWPEENSAFQKVLSVVNELERVNEMLATDIRKKQSKNTAMSAREILAHAFETAVTKVTTTQAVVDLEETRLPAGDEKDFCFDGRIFGVREVMNFLAENRRSGVLRIEGGGESFRIYLSMGDVVGAVSTNSPPGMRLGDILVERYGVDKARLEDLIQRSAGREQLGQALAREELVTQAVVYDALRFQIAQLFERCLACEGSDIHYDNDINHVMGQEGPSINLADLLLDGILG